MRGTSIHIEINNKKHIILLTVLDHVFSALVVAPAVVCYWRGTWVLSDLYVFPDNYDISMLTSLVFGCSGQLILTCFQSYLTDNLSPSKNRMIYYIISRFYTYLFGAVCVNLWRGIWKALDLFSGQDIVKVLIPTFTSFVFLIASRTFGNVASSPFFVALDLAEGYFTIPTMFKLMAKMKTREIYCLIFSSIHLALTFISMFNFLYAFATRTVLSRTKRYLSKANRAVDVKSINALFSVFVVGCLVVFVWRGVWCIFDIYLYPNDEVFSAVISLTSVSRTAARKVEIITATFTDQILGYVIVLIVFSLQSFMKKWCSKLTGFWRLAVLDVYILISFIGTINVWRGIWNLINIYFLPESPALSCWITHFGCFVFLVLLNCSNTLLVKGVAVDGEERGQCGIFPMSYLRILCKGSDKKDSEEEEDQMAKSNNNVTL